jgi:MATE family multidrug resistance protein
LTEGLSFARPSLWFGLLGLLLAGPIAYVLMYGRLGVPAQGAAGAGMAMAIVVWLQAFAYYLYIRRHPRFRSLGRERPLRRRPDARQILALLRLGVPMAVTLVMEVGLFLAAALVIGRLGDVAMASHQIALNLTSLAFMLPLGLSMAITVRVALARGRQDLIGMRRAGYVGLGVTLITQLLLATVMLTMPFALAGLYTHDKAIIAGAALLLQLAGLFQLSDGIQVVANGALRGLKDTRVPMLVTFFAYWMVGMPIGTYLSIGRAWGPAGMWVGLLAGLSMSALLLSYRFVRATRSARERHFFARTEF